jgi:hypothetical protein
MTERLLSRIAASPVLQVLILISLVILIRGAEGLGAPITLDINDSIVFYQIANSPDFPASSISARFSTTIVGIGTTFWPNIALQALGLSPEQQYFVLYLAQMATLAGGLLYFFRAFDSHFAFVLFAVLLALVSGYTGFGRYLALGGTFKIVTSTFAMTIGFFVLGMYLRSRDIGAAALASLLASYQPSHGAALLAVVFGHAAWSALQGRTRRKELYRLAAVTAACLLPFLLLVVARLPSGEVYDPDGWWAYVFSKTSNLTPLQDGALVAAAIIGTLLLGAAAARAEQDRQPDAQDDTMRRVVTLICVVIFLWAVQILASELLRSVTLTQLALTRSTPYAVLAIVAVYASKLFRALKDGEPAERAAALILVAGMIGMVAKSTRDLAILPGVNLPVLDFFQIRHHAVLLQAPMALLTGVLAWWCWLPHMTTLRRKRATALLVTSVLVFALVFGLRLSILSAALALLLLRRPQIGARLKIAAGWSFVVVGVLAVTVLLDRNPWKRSPVAHYNLMTEIVQVHVAPGAMVLNIPAVDRAADHLLPTRASFMGWSEGQYMIYLPSLEPQVSERLELLGVHPVANATQCSGWLLKPMCRRELYLDKARDQDDAWRGRLEQMRRIAPTLSHALIRSSHLCQNDRPTARIAELTLVALADVAPPGCLRAGN